MTSRTRRAQAGFTLMELMVVVAIIAMIAVFALPRLGKHVAVTKVTDVINALANMNAQVEASCATRGQLPGDLSNLLSGTPSGYVAPIFTTGTAGGTCVSGYVIKLAAETGSDLPSVCIRRDGKYGVSSIPQGSQLTTDDIPLPTSKTTDGPAC